MIYLRKANDELLSRCRCASSEALINFPAQADCPWCGCGWLFSCSRCRKGFTFAEGVEVDFTLEEMARRELQRWQKEPDPDEIHEWTVVMGELLAPVEVGGRYVYFDGRLFPAEPGAISFSGLHSAHELAEVPQVGALRDPSVLRDVLQDEDYWYDTALPEKDDDEEDDEGD